MRRTNETAWLIIECLLELKKENKDIDMNMWADAVMKAKEKYEKNKRKT